MRSVGLKTAAYHVDVPSFGDWGFHLAARSTPRVAVPGDASAMRFVDSRVLLAAQTFPPDRAQLTMPPSTLLHPAILDAIKGSYRGY